MILMAFIERRKNIRYDFPVFVEYRLIPDIPHKVYKNVTVNISISGFCLALSGPISKGMKIEIQKDVPFCPKLASVSWVTKIDERAYLAGFTCN